MGHRGSIYSAIFDVQSQQLFSGGGDGWLVSWAHNSVDGQLIADVGDQIFSICNIDTQRLAVGTMAGEIYFLGKSSRDTPRRKVFHDRGVFDLVLFKDKLISAGGDGKLGFWNTNTTEIEESIALTHNRIRSLSLNPAASLLAAGCSGGDIFLLSTTNWSVVDIISEAHIPSVFSLCWDDNDTLLSGGRDAHLKQWKISDLDKPQYDLAAHWYTINHLHLNPTLPILATASRDKTIRLWSTDTLDLIQTLDSVNAKGHINSVNRLAWTTDGTQLFAVSDDASISVWQFS